MTATKNQEPLKKNKQGHILGEVFEDGYAKCSLCGANGKGQALYKKCKEKLIN